MLAAPAFQFPSGEVVTCWDGPSPGREIRPDREAEYRRAEALLAVGIVTALIRLDGTHCGFFHHIGGIDLRDLDAVRGRIKPGTTVRAVWRERKEGCIMDIQYFEPV